MSTDDASMLEVLSVLLSAMTTTLEKLDRIADRVADIAVFTEAMYVENMNDIRKREGV